MNSPKKAFYKKLSILAVVAPIIALLLGAVVHYFPEGFPSMPPLVFVAYVVGAVHAVFLLWPSTWTAYDKDGPAHVGIAMGEHHLKIGPVTLAVEKRPCVSLLFLEQVWKPWMLHRAAEEINIHIRNGRGFMPNDPNRCEDVKHGITFVNDVACVQIEETGTCRYVPVWEMVRDSRLSNDEQSRDFHMIMDLGMMQNVVKYYLDHPREIEELIQCDGEETYEASGSEKEDGAVV